MSYDYDEPEAAAIDLLEDNEIEEVYYGLVRATWTEGGAVVFYDIDSGNSVGLLENKLEEEMFEEIVRLLVKSDEEIRSEL